jgi:mono/diheme cytochrome c family protein
LTVLATGTYTLGVSLTHSHATPSRRIIRRSAIVAVTAAVLLLGRGVPPPGALAQNRADAVAGKQIYERNCASCHGKRGEGLGGTSALPNFADRQAMARKSDQELLRKITDGGPGTGMPAFGKILSEQARLDVLAYIRSLAASK